MLRVEGSAFVRGVLGLMISRDYTRYVALVLFFTLCQVIGAMCVLPEISAAEEESALVEDVMTCPMDGTTMCPPSATSSPERQIKSSAVADVDHATILLSPSTDLTTLSVPTLCSWSNAFSIVPLSIDSSSVLRI
jgi:hypothetical protein